MLPNAYVLYSSKKSKSNLTEKNKFKGKKHNRQCWWCGEYIGEKESLNLKNKANMPYSEPICQTHQERVGKYLIRSGRAISYTVTKYS